ncbi:P2X purinoceptor 7-like [Mercenaria mercenaria]|uniref:P2X purinoceptor 7-like n=1 Tax=Mercenaria mercenaria TaxID=6596 RepID=UPI00234E3FA2|nr:P2X purinoceptor 7-like [Mercenaria mercenaria]
MASNNNFTENIDNSDSDSSFGDEFPENNGIGYVGYRFEQQVGSSDELSESDESESDGEPEIEIGNLRMDNLDWCSCSNCIIMRTETENICCREIQNVLTKEEDDNIVEECICEHPKFNTLCLDRDVLCVAAITVSSMFRTDLPNPLTDRFFRLTAYRQFTLWIHGKLGRHNRRTIPSCVVRRIRDVYPHLEEGQEQFTGFLFP